MPPSETIIRASCNQLFPSLTFDQPALLGEMVWRRKKRATRRRPQSTSKGINSEWRRVPSGLVRDRQWAVFVSRRRTPKPVSLCRRGSVAPKICCVVEGGPHNTTTSSELRLPGPQLAVYVCQTRRQTQTGPPDRRNISASAPHHSTKQLTPQLPHVQPPRTPDVRPVGPTVVEAVANHTMGHVPTRLPTRWPSLPATHRTANLRRGTTESAYNPFGQGASSLPMPTSRASS